MGANSSCFCIVAPEETDAIARYAVRGVLHAYQVGAGPRLCRSCGPISVSGGLLGIRLGAAPPEGNADSFCRQCVLECRSRGAAGVLADWEQFSREVFRFTRTLGHALERAGLTVMVPEAYAGVTDSALVMISSALSGGSLELRLHEAAERYGASRLVLALERLSDDFRLPAAGGTGRHLSAQELSGLRQRRPCIYWSEDLCTRYFTYCGRDGVHFVLFDDAASLQRKLEIAQKSGIRRWAAAWSEISDCAGTLLPAP